jgi:hypothetical protein
MTSGATAISETVHDFLTLPGIAGLAVVEGQNPTFFCNIDGTLLPQDEAQLARNLSQVFTTIPLEFTTIELHHPSYQTHLYRIDYATLLLVLVHPNSLEPSHYQAILHRFMDGLRQSREAVIEALSLQPPSAPPAQIFDQSTDDLMGVSQSNSAFQLDTSDLETILQTLTIDLGPTAQATEPPAAPDTKPLVSSDTAEVPSSIEAQPASLQAVIDAFNHLTRLAVDYLGKIIVGNQIKMSRPEDDWFLQFTIDTQAQLVINPAQWMGQTYVAPEQHKLFQEWAYQVMRATARVIRNFQDDVESQLSLEEKTLLFEASRRS